MKRRQKAFLVTVVAAVALVTLIALLVYSTSSDTRQRTPIVTTSAQLSLPSGTEWQAQPPIPRTGPTVVEAKHATPKVPNVYPQPNQANAIPELRFADPPPRHGVTGVEWQTDSTNRSGLGTLDITNGTSKDGVAILFEQTPDDTDEAVRAIYVRSHQHATMRKVVPGRYILRFMLGVDWDEGDREFKRAVEFHAFAEAFDFAETATENAIEYSKQSVTLHKVVNGNARSVDVDRRAVRFDTLTRIP